MKNFLIPALALLLSGSIFTSCKKCSECVATDSAGNVVGSSGEFCGKSSYIDDTEAAFESTWSLGGNTVECTRK